MSDRLAGGVPQFLLILYSIRLELFFESLDMHIRRSVSVLSVWLIRLKSGSRSRQGMDGKQAGYWVSTPCSSLTRTGVPIINPSSNREIPVIFFLRRHRRHLGRTLLGLFALALMSMTLQPCALAHAQTPAPAMDHHAMHHSMAMDHTAMHHHEEMPQNHCASGSDCPAFKAVDNQAAPKAADTVHLFKIAPALFAFFPLPAQPVVRSTFDRQLALAPVPPPPILEFCVLRI